MSLIIQPNTPLGQWLATEDVKETLPDGRVVLIARKGRPVPAATAARAGLGPAETKVTGPAETKEDAPAETKTEDAPPPAKPKPPKAPKD